MRGLILGLCVAVGGCSLFVSGDDTADAVDAGDGVDAAEPDGAAPRSCRRVPVLQDAFDDGVIDTALWTEVSGASVVFTEQDDELVIAPVSGEPDLGALESARFDLTEGHASIGVNAVPTGDAEPFSRLTVAADADNQIVFQVHNNVITMQTAVGGNLGFSAVTTYSAIAHRYWRIRISAGMVLWEASQDNVRFNHLAQAPIDIVVSDVSVSLGASANGDPSVTGALRIEGIEVATDPDTGWCPAELLADDFEDGELLPLWSKFEEGGGRVFEEAGHLRLVPIDGIANDAGVASRDRFALTDSSVAIELDRVSEALDPLIPIVFMIRFGGDDFAEFRAGPTVLRLRQQAAGDETPTEVIASWDPNVDRWWRFFHATDTGLSWQVGADGTNWRTVAGMTPPWPLDSVEVLVFTPAPDATESPAGELRVLTIGAP